MVYAMHRSFCFYGVNYVTTPFFKRMIMRIKLPQIVLSALVYFFLVPLQACQPERVGNYVVDLEDGEHVFVMLAHHDVAFEYPVSGVYRKGPVKQLVWEYRGWFINGRELENRISANGRYFVQTHIPYQEQPQPVYLSIYDNGKLIREFNRDIFIDDISQVYLPNCSMPYWAHLKYDKQSDQLKIESKAKRVVTIDVPSAEILSVDNVRRMRIDGVITFKDGSKQEIQEIGNCGELNFKRSMFRLRKEDGLTDVSAFIAFENGIEAVIEG